MSPMETVRKTQDFFFYEGYSASDAASSSHYTCMSMRCDNITADGRGVLSHPADIILSQVSGPTFNLLVFLCLLAKYLPLQPVRFIRVFFFFFAKQQPMEERRGAAQTVKTWSAKPKQWRKEQLKKLWELQSWNFFSPISALRANPFTLQSHFMQR